MDRAYKIQPYKKKDKTHSSFLRK